MTLSGNLMEGMPIVLRHGDHALATGCDQLARIIIDCIGVILMLPLQQIHRGSTRWAAEAIDRLAFMVVQPAPFTRRKFFTTGTFDMDHWTPPLKTMNSYSSSSPAIETEPTWISTAVVSTTALSLPRANHANRHQYW